MNDPKWGKTEITSMNITLKSNRNNLNDISRFFSGNTMEHFMSDPEPLLTVPEQYKYNGAASKSFWVLINLP